MHVVTGGAGFIGSNILWGLEQRETERQDSDRHDRARLVVCDRLGDGEKWRNIAKRELHDIVDPATLLTFLDDHGSNVDAIIHMGAISATTETDVDLIVEANFRLSRDLWLWCTHHQVPFIYASSAATYGDGEAGFDDADDIESLARLRPLNAYGWSKQLFDRWVVRSIARGDARPPHWAGLKFFNVYGPNEGHKGRMASVVSQIQPLAATGEPCRLFKSHHPGYADGGQLRDFVWVDDCVAQVLWLLDHPDVNGIFNCGSGKARSFADLAKAVYAAAGREPLIEFVPTPEDIRDKYQYFTEARMDRLRAAGYGGNATSLEDGVRDYVTGYLATDDPYR